MYVFLYLVERECTEKERSPRDRLPIRGPVCNWSSSCAAASSLQLHTQKSNIETHCVYTMYIFNTLFIQCSIVRRSPATFQKQNFSTDEVYRFSNSCLTVRASPADALLRLRASASFAIHLQPFAAHGRRTSGRGAGDGTGRAS